MARGTFSIDDYLEDRIKSYMKLNKVKTKNKAINEILSIFFENERVFNNIKEIDKKIDNVLKSVYLIKLLNEQIYANLGFRENVIPKNDYALNEFYDNIKKEKFKIFD